MRFWVTTENFLERKSPRNFEELQECSDFSAPHLKPSNIPTVLFISFLINHKSLFKITKTSQTKANDSPISCPSGLKQKPKKQKPILKVVIIRITMITVKVILNWKIIQFAYMFLNVS
jgi:hypothetical protein